MAWDATFTFNQWRPVTAIRAAGSGGDASSETDARWTPLLVTPPFPDYIAGHTTYGGAAERVLERLLGKQLGVVMQLRSATAPGVVRTYTTFEAISKDLVELGSWAAFIGGRPPFGDESSVNVSAITPSSTSRASRGGPERWACSHQLASATTNEIAMSSARSPVLSTRAWRRSCDGTSPLGWFG